MEPNNNQLHVGGTLSSGYKFYIEREADHILYESLKNGEFCYVLTARQMGKSSLRARIMQKLQTEGHLCLELDLTGLISADTSANEWYFTFVHYINTAYTVIEDLRQWWDQQEPLSPIAKMNVFLKDEFLPRIDTNVVIFMDEVDKLLSLDGTRFRIDDFFAAIRAFYNKRVDEPMFKRLNFAFFGVASPDDLINDPQRTPFNIGKSIELRNFYLNELSVFKDALNHLKVDIDKLLREIHKWTNGQPILTAKLIKDISEQEFYFYDIADKVREYVFQLVEKDTSEHFQNIENRITLNKEYGAQMLTLYQQLYYEIKLKYNPAYDVHIYLKLTGLAENRQGWLEVNNAIYRQVFASEWITRHLKQFHRPYADELDAWLRHQKDPRYCLKGKKLRRIARQSAQRQDLLQIEHQFLHASQTEARKRGSKRGGAMLFIIALLFIVSIFGLRKLNVKTSTIQELDSVNTVLTQTTNKRDSMVKALKQTRDSLKTSNDSVEVLSEQRRKINANLKRKNKIIKKQNAQLTRKNKVIQKQQEASALAYKAKTKIASNPPLAMKLARKANSLSNENIYRQTLFEAYKNYVECDTLKNPPPKIKSVYFNNDSLYITTNQENPGIYLYTMKHGIIKNGFLRGIPRKVQITSDSTLSVFYGTHADVFSKKLHLLDTLRLGAKDFWMVAWDPERTEIIGININRFCRHLATDSIKCREFPISGYSNSLYISEHDYICMNSRDDLHIYNLQGELVKRFSTEANIRDYDYAAENHTMVAATDNNALIFWNLDTGHKLHKMKVRSPVQVLKVSPDGSLLVTSHTDKSLKIRDVYGQPVKELYGLPRRSRMIAISEDNRRIATRDSANLRLWHNTVPEVLYAGSKTSFASYVPDDSLFFTVNKTALQVIHRTKGTTKQVELSDMPVDVAAIAQQGRFFAWFDKAEKAVGIYSRSTEEVNRILLGKTNVADMQFDNSDNSLYMSTKEGFVIKIAPYGKLQDTVYKHEYNTISRIAISPDGNLLAMVKNSKLFVKDFAKDSLWFVEEFFETSANLKFVDNRTLLYSPKDKQAVLYYTDGRKAKQTWKLPGNSVFIDWHPEREALLAVTSYGKAFVQNKSNEIFQETVKYHQAFTDAAFLGDSEAFFLATAEGRIYINYLKPPLQLTNQ